MTIFEVYNQSIKMLKNPDVEEINVRILLCEVNGLESMSSFYLKKDEKIKDLQRFQAYFARFLNGEPLQYILGKTTFYGLNFYVNSSVLIPRQETEEVVHFALNKIHENFGENPIDILDLCSGSGCIGISIAKNHPANSIIFSDISNAAMNVCKQNVEAHNLKARFFIQDCLDEHYEKVDVLVSNPPYILKKEDVDKNVLDYEPHLALFIDDELTIYEKIFKKLPLLKKEKLICIFEIGYDLRDKLIELINNVIPNSEYEFVKDMNGKDRILFIEIK